MTSDMRGRGRAEFLMNRRVAEAGQAVVMSAVVIMRPRRVPRRRKIRVLGSHLCKLITQRALSERRLPRSRVCDNAKTT